MQKRKRQVNDSLPSQKEGLNNSCSLLILSFATWDEVVIDLPEPRLCAASLRKSQAPSSPLGGVWGAGRVSKGDLLAQGKELLVFFLSFLFTGSVPHFFHLRGECYGFGAEFYGVKQEGVAAVPSPAGGTCLRWGWEVPPLEWSFHLHRFPQYRRSKVHAGLPV